MTKTSEASVSDQGEGTAEERAHALLFPSKYDGTSQAVASLRRENEVLRSNSDHLSSENASLASQVESMAMRIESLAEELSKPEDVRLREVLDALDGRAVIFDGLGARVGHLLDEMDEWIGRAGEAERMVEAARRSLSSVAESMTEHAYQELASALESPPRIAGKTADFDPPGREYTTGDALGLRRTAPPHSERRTHMTTTDETPDLAALRDEIAELAVRAERFEVERDAARAERDRAVEEVADARSAHAVNASNFRGRISDLEGESATLKERLMEAATLIGAAREKLFKWNTNGELHAQAGQLDAWLAAEALIKAGKCVECKGRGWHIGDCHPRETCGACDGTGAGRATPKERR